MPITKKGKAKKENKDKIKKVKAHVEKLAADHEKYSKVLANLEPDSKIKPRKLRFIAKRQKKNKKKTQYSIAMKKRDGSLTEFVVSTNNPDTFKYNKMSYFVTQNAMIWHRDLGMYHLEYVEGISLPTIVFHDWDELLRQAKEEQNIVQHSLLDATLFDEFCKGSYINTLLSAYKKLNDNVKLIIVLCALAFFSNIFGIVINWYFLNDGLNRILAGG